MVTTDAPAEADTESNASWSPARIAWSVVAVVVVAMAALVVVPSEWHFALYPQDEGLLLVYPWLILHGWQPNRSFESVYGVVNLWVLGGAFKIGGASVDVERTVGLVYRLIVVGSLTTLGLRRRGPVAGLCAGLVSVVMLSGTIGLAAFAWLAGLAFAALGLLLVDLGLAGTLRRWTIGAAGLCFGLMIGCRLDLAIAAGLAVGIVITLRPRARAPLAVGFVLGLIPLGVNLIQAGLPAVLHQQVLAPIFVTGPGRRLPLMNSGWQAVAVIVLCVGVACALAVSGWRSVRIDSTRWDGVLLLVVGCVDLGLIPEALQRVDVTHLALVACWVVPSAMLLPAMRLPWPPAQRPRHGGINVLPLIVTAIALVLVAQTFARTYRSEIPSSGIPVPVNVVVHDGRSVPTTSAEQAMQLRSLLASVDANTRPGQRLFVGPQDLTTAGYADTYLYYLLPGLTPATRYLEMDPGVANGKDSVLAQELHGADVLILNSAYDTFPDADPSTRHGSPIPNQVVAREFRPVATAGTWTLYVRRSR